MGNTRIIQVIQGILQSVFVLGLSIQFIVLVVLLEQKHKYLFVTPFVTTASKLSILVVLIMYICILLSGIYTFVQNFDITKNTIKRNILLLCSNSIIITSIKLLYKVITEKVNDFGILIQTRYYTVYYNFSLEEKLEWYPRFIQETHKEITEINLFVLNQAKNYSQFKDLLLEQLKKQSEQDPITLNTIYDILLDLNTYTFIYFCGVCGVSFVVGWAIITDVYDFKKFFGE